MEDKLQKLQDLLKDSEKVEKIFTSDLEETQRNLAEAGVELTKEELMAFAEGVRDSSEEEVTEQELEAVSGGAKKYKSQYEQDCYNAGKVTAKVLKTAWNILKWFAV